MVVVDSALRQRLIDRGMTEKLAELEKATGEATKAGSFGTIAKETVKGTVIPTAKFVAPLGESIGAALATGTAKKLQAEATKTQMALADRVIKQLRDPNISKENKSRLYKAFSQTNPDIIGQVPELQETAAQTFGKGAITALSTLGLGKLQAKGALAGVTSKILGAGKYVDKLGKTVEIGKTGVKLEQSLGPQLAGAILRTGRTALGGAAWGTAMALEQGKTEAKEIGKEAGIISAISVLAPPILGRALKFSMREIGGAARASSQWVEKTIPYLKNLAEKSGKKTGNFLTDTASRKPAGFLNTIAEIESRAAEKITKPLEPQLTDRLYALLPLERKLEQDTGKAILMTPESAYLKARNYAGIQGKYTVAATDFDNIFEKGEFKDVKDDVYGYIKGLDLFDRASKGQAVEGGKSIEEIRNALNEIEGRVPKEKLAKAVQQYNEFTKTKILQEFVDSGIKSPEQEQAMLEANPNWTPHDILDFFENEAAESFKGGGSFNVFDNPIKQAEGSLREVAPVREATLHRLHQAQVIAERNRVVSQTITNVEKTGEPAVYGFTPLRTAEKVKARQSIFNEIIDTVNQQQGLIKDDKVLAGLQAKAVGKIKKTAQLPAESQAIKDLGTKIRQTNKEAEEIYNEARTLAAQFEPASDIKPLLSKVDTREKKVAALTDKLVKEVEDYNFSNFQTLKQQQAAVERIKGTRQSLEQMITERAEDIKAMRQAVKELKDIKIKGVDIQKAGMEKISFWREGIREDWLVPSDIGRALKNLDAYQVGTIMKWLKIPADILRATATRLNIAFPLSNVPRDIQTAMGVTEKGLTREQLVDALNTVADLNNPETRAFFQSGGAFGGLVATEKPSRDILQAGKRAKILDLPIKISDLLQSIGERTENTTRFAVWKQAKTNGYSDDVAAYIARNATVDFAKQGNLIAAINQVVPFLNARTQGLVNVATALNNDPTRFVRNQLFQGVYPAMLLYAHNNNYESFQSIPKQERDNYWIIMIGERDGFDTSGAPMKIPDYRKIRKSEVQMLAANTVEQYFDMTNKENPRELSRFLKDNILNFSPVSDSSLGPLTTPLELTANYDLFRHAPIEPENQELVAGGKKYQRDQVPSELRAQRWNGATSRNLSELGLSKLGLSPARIEFVVGKIFASVGKDILSVADMAQTGFDLSGVPEGKATTAQKLSRTPIFRSFIGSSASAEKIWMYEVVEKISKDQVEKIELPKELQAQSYLDMIMEVYKKEGKDKANEYYKSLNLNKDMKQRIKRIKNNLDTGETHEVQIYNKLQSNIVKTKFLIEILNSIDSKKAKNQLIKDVKPSKEVKKLLRQAQQQGKIKRSLTD